MSQNRKTEGLQILAEKLRSTLTETLPYCSGTVPVKPRDILLYYGKKDDELGRIDLMNPSPDALDRLEKVCQPATFGLNDKDVLDESYRKAGKLDIDSFMLAFDAERTGLLDAVRMALFPGREETRSIDAELYKLNIYGKDAFFKPHKDTPRAPHMFGSLVIVFPTPHTGGALNLRYEDKEYTFDASQLLTKPELVPFSRTDNEPKDVHSPHVAFVAFFSDVEHEVMPVTSGHRITITYNLYFAMGTPAAYLRARTHAIQLAQPRALHADSIADAVHALINDPSCLKSGGTLGFGLRHQYPLPQSWTLGDPNPLRQLEDFLKGNDAALFRALEEEGLLPVLRLYYDAEYSGSSGVLLDRVVDVELPGSEDSLYTQTINRGGIPVELTRAHGHSNDQVEPGQGGVHSVRQPIYPRAGLRGPVLGRGYA
ncbi:hypothetical protein C8Q74DRAFT_1248588, partial [Fomes fomentarius]